VAVRHPGIPQVVRDDIIADYVRELQIVGPLGVLNVSDTIVGMFFMGQRVPFEVTVSPPLYTSADVFSAGKQVAAGSGTVFADTTALPAGDYDISVIVTAVTAVNALAWLIQHRDAANAANLSELTLVAHRDGHQLGSLQFAYTVATDERIRVVNDTNFAAGENAACNILAVRR